MLDLVSTVARRGSRAVIRSASDIAELGTILGIWAHPDDEAYLSGGLMAMASDIGSRVVCVTATRGERGTSDPVAWPPHRLAAERTAELASCLEILGVAEHHWLDYRDGECAAVPASEPTARLVHLIERVCPDTVLTFGPDGITGHQDHVSVSVWATAAFDRAAAPGTRLLYAAVSERRALRWKALDESLGVFLPGYPVTAHSDRLTVDIALSADSRSRKVRALTAQVTQTAELIARLGVDRYTAWVGQESFALGRVQPSVVDLVYEIRP